MNVDDDIGRAVLLLQQALAGDASTVGELRGVSKAALKSAGDQLGGTLTFGRPTVLRVLRDWRAGHVTEEQVQLWALLMFASHPLDIDYSDDDVVNEVVFELKDIGDEIDGVITPAERNEMIERLESSA